MLHFPMDFMMKESPDIEIGPAEPLVSPVLETSSVATKLLLSIASKRESVNGSRCMVVLTHLEIATRLRRHLRSVLARYYITELQFGVLVILAADPQQTVPASVIASRTNATRASITEALDKLELGCLAQRFRGGGDRRIVKVGITSAGQSIIESLFVDYFKALEEASLDLTPLDIQHAMASYELFTRRLP